MYARTRWLFALLPVLALTACATQKTEPVAEKPTAHVADSYALVAPIPKDKIDDWKAMVDEMKAKQDAHTASNQAVGVEKEQVFLQETPAGAAAVVYFEGHELKDMMVKRWGSEDEYTKWFVAQITNIHGLPQDITQMPANEMVFKGDVEGVEGVTRPFAMSAPILPGKEVAHAAFCAELTGARHDAWLESRRSRGIAKEYAWNQKAQDGTMVTVVYFEVTDPANLNTPPTSEFETWFREQLRDIHGIPVDGVMPSNMLMATF